MSLLTGACHPTTGAASVCGLSLRTHRAAGLSRVGICLQTDPLLERLTPMEHLRLYAVLHGVPAAEVAAACDALLARVGLAPFRDVCASTLSGGNARKLSLAIALVGSPMLLVADEPSCGLDPGARREVWAALEACMAAASAAPPAPDGASSSSSAAASAAASPPARVSLLLTTHSMEEAEALCGRVAILAGGQLRCVGTPSQLKAGCGHAVDAKARPGLGDALEAALRRAFGEHAAIERHGDKINVSVPSRARCGGNVADVYAAMLSLDDLTEDWAVGQASLEAVFVAVAGAHKADPAAAGDNAA